jgi:RNA polymerase sigma factor (sigma-70 family)
MDISRKREEEFIGILNGYDRLINSLIHNYNLPKYGLDPEDVVQEVKVRIWKIVCADRVIHKHGAYIKKIVYTAIIDQFRKNQREEELLRHEKHKHISETKSYYDGEAIRKNALSEVLWDALERLIKSRRQVVKLYLLNLNIREISSYLNMSQDKIRNLLYRGLADIRKYLQNAGIHDEPEP